MEPTKLWVVSKTSPLASLTRTRPSPSSTTTANTSPCWIPHSLQVRRALYRPSMTAGTLELTFGSHRRRTVVHVKRHGIQDGADPAFEQIAYNNDQVRSDLKSPLGYEVGQRLGRGHERGQEHG